MQSYVDRAGRPILIVLGAVASITASQSVNAEQWFFFVQNQSSSKIIKLEAKEENRPWGSFAMAGSINPGETKKIVWAESSNNQGCNQYLRATFADGHKSPATLFDFCKDLHDPIVYND